MESVPLEDQDKCGRVTPKRKIRNCAVGISIGSGPGRIEGFCVDVSGCRSTVTDVRKAVPCFCTQRTALFNTSVVHVTMGLRLVPGTLAACFLLPAVSGRSGAPDMELTHNRGFVSMHYHVLSSKLRHSFDVRD
jgi:hypothetical protein